MNERYRGRDGGHTIKKMLVDFLNFKLMFLNFVFPTIIFLCVIPVSKYLVN